MSARVTKVLLHYMRQHYIRRYENNRALSGTVDQLGQGADTEDSRQRDSAVCESVGVETAFDTGVGNGGVQ